MRKYLQKTIIVPLIICGLTFPTGVSSGSFEDHEKNKYRVSLYAQVFAPAAVVGTISAFEKLVKKHYATHVDEYLRAKSMFYQFIEKNGPKAMNLTKEAAGYSAFWQAMNLSFVGLRRAMNIPATIGWTAGNMISKRILSDENAVIPSLIKKGFKLDTSKSIAENLMPDKLPSFDFNLKENARISAYVKNGKIRIQESIWSNQKNFIKEIQYAADGKSATITVDNFGLKMFESESNVIKISLKDNFTSTARKVDMTDFIIENAENIWKGSDSASKASPMIWDIGVNVSGRNPIYNKLKGLTGFIFESSGRGYDVPVHKLASFLSGVSINTSIGFAMGEVFRQITHGMFNFAPHLYTSYDILMTFMLSGIIGKATGSRLIELGTLTGVKLDRLLMKKFPKLQQRFPYRKQIGDLNSCTDFIKYVIRPPIRGRTDLTMKLVQHMLLKRGNIIYKYGTLALGAEIGWRFAYHNPNNVQKIKDTIYNFFHPISDDPDAPYDLSGFPPIDAETHSLTGNEGVDVETDTTISEDLKSSLQNILPSMATAEQANLANMEQAYNEDNGIGESALEIDQESISELYEMQTDAVTSVMADYEKNPEAYTDLLWLSFLMTAPVKMLQEEYINKVNLAMEEDEPVVAVKGVFYDFMEEIGLGYNKRDVYKSFEDEFRQSDSMFMDDYIAEKVVAFIGLSDVVQFAKGYEDLQAAEIERLNTEGE